MGNYTIHGSVHKYGDNINTDLINPSPSINLDRALMNAAAMRGVDPDFTKKVKPGDIIVAGKNFGCGSSRETAPIVIKENGVSAVIADFFARIFYRNCINIGLTVLTTDQTHRISDGDELEVDTRLGIIYNITTGEQYTCTRLPENVQELVDDGGLIEHLKKKLAAK